MAAQTPVMGADHLEVFCMLFSMLQQDGALSVCNTNDIPHMGFFSSPSYTSHFLFLLPVNTSQIRYQGLAHP